MRIGFIGLGRMGLNMVSRLLKANHEVVGFALSESSVRRAQRRGAQGARSIRELCDKLPKQKVIWMMIPQGKPVEITIRKLLPCLSRGDIIVDGGNSNFNDSVRRARMLKKKGIYYVDCGTSGGLGGAKDGYSLMVGGEKAAVKRVAPLLRALANNPPHGYLHIGPSGSGHYVKMVHNGIEYGLLQAYGEGFELFTKSPYDLNFSKIAHVWNNGGVIRSWLLELAEGFFAKDPRLRKIKGVIGGGTTGRWTVQEARKRKVKLPVIEASLRVRQKTARKEGSFSSKVVAAFRHAFGGHAVKKK